MQRQVDEELRKLKEKILTMGGEVERAVEEATQALILREASRLQRVFELEERINKDHIEVDEDCLKLLATQSPLAADLRMVVAVIKINNDLERMGDQAVNIAFNAEKYFKLPALKPLIDIPKMAEKVRLMIRTALDALVNADPTQAQSVLDMDDEVDQLKHQVFVELIHYMERDPSSVSRAMCLILIARNLERLGDHATNVAEDVIFATTGKDVRHRSLQQ